MKAKYGIVSRGFCGWAFKGSNEAVSGCYSDAQLEAYLPYAEGAFCYDAKHLEHTDKADAFISFVYSGPIPCQELPDNTMLNLFDTVPSPYNAENCNGLTKVSLDIFENLVKKIPGIKTGIVKDGKIVWDS